MARHLLNRFLLTLPALWLVLSLVFLLIHIVPGDPVEQMLGEGAAPGQVAELRHSLGLDRPLLVQYGRYLWEVAHGDLGQSFKFQAPVRRIIFERYPATMQLAFLALLVCVAIAIPAGVISAHRRGHVTDRAVSVFTLFGLAVPNFAFGPLLITLFSIQLGWLPVSGRGGLLNYILPAATLGAALAGTLLAGTIVTETIFSWPGIGRLTVQAISSRDYPLLQGCILVIALSYVLVNLLTDVLYSLVDPRVRLS